LDAVVAAVGIPVGAFVVGAISSLVPIVSIEVFVVAVALASGAPLLLPLVVVLATVGQVVGKLPVYFAARKAAALPGRHQRWVTRARRWLARFGDQPLLLLATSASLGLPPFSIISTAAGALAIPPRAFCLVVAAGRALRLGVLVAIAAVAQP
jgi:membrane protein YqaA with SNARE-associated domain